MNPFLKSLFRNQSDVMDKIVDVIEEQEEKIHLLTQGMDILNKRVEQLEQEILKQG